MNHPQLHRSTGILLIIMVLLSNIPYLLLIKTFEYDDILREPVDYVLLKFYSGGTALIWTWLMFALTALLLIPASFLLHEILAHPNLNYLRISTFMGAVSGILQCIGLMRWVFVIPGLASMQVDPSTDEATKTAVRIAYQVVHQYGGGLY